MILKVKNHIFEIIESIPYGYKVWNIGKNMPDGYLPLVQVGGYNGCQVNINTMKALKLPDAQLILSVTTYGQGTIIEMERYIKRHQSSKNGSIILHSKKLESVLEIMRQIDGVQHLEDVN